MTGALAHSAGPGHALSGGVKGSVRGSVRHTIERAALTRSASASRAARSAGSSSACSVDTASSVRSACQNFENSGANVSISGFRKRRHGALQMTLQKQCTCHAAPYPREGMGLQRESGGIRSGCRRTATVRHRREMSQAADSFHDIGIKPMIMLRISCRSETTAWQASSLHRGSACDLRDGARGLQAFGSLNIAGSRRCRCSSL